jgi:hypothetical protein
MNSSGEVVWRGVCFPSAGMFLRRDLHCITLAVAICRARDDIPCDYLKFAGVFRATMRWSAALYR